MPIYYSDIELKELNRITNLPSECLVKNICLILSHVKKIPDIDELLSDYQNWTHGEPFSEYLQFRGFLQSRYDTQEGKK